MYLFIHQFFRVIADVFSQKSVTLTMPSFQKLGQKNS